MYFYFLPFKRFNSHFPLFFPPSRQTTVVFPDRSLARTWTCCQAKSAPGVYRLAFCKRFTKGLISLPRFKERESEFDCSNTGLGFISKAVCRQQVCRKGVFWAPLWRFVHALRMNKVWNNHSTVTDQMNGAFCLHQKKDHLCCEILFYPLKRSQRACRRLSSPSGFAASVLFLFLENQKVETGKKNAVRLNLDDFSRDFWKYLNCSASTIVVAMTQVSFSHKKKTV